MENKTGKSVSLAVTGYFKEIGVPERLICDQVSELVKGYNERLCHNAECTVIKLK